MAFRTPPVQAAAAARRSGPSMWRRYAMFLRTPPEFTMAWHDRPTGARAWLVINSLRGGAAGGGTRMHGAVDPREVIHLAKVMELKFAISGPAIGGAKTGIAFDPADPRRAEVLERWFRAALPVLRDRYGTGGDLNVDEVLDVIPCLERLGLEHPQEGVVRGHLDLGDERFRTVIRRLQEGVKAPVDGMAGVHGLDLAVADVITGYGVAAAVRDVVQRSGRAFDGARVLLEGFGNVGAAAGLYLARLGARIVCIRDAHHTLVEPAGLGAEEMEHLVRRRENKMLPASDPRVRSCPEQPGSWNAPADVFVCAAISESITPATLDQLEAAGVGVIACGANQPFREARLGSTLVAQDADRRFAVIPDIIANCGMARTFSYLMEAGAEPAAPPVFAAVERTIRNTLGEVFERSAGRTTGLLSATLGVVLDRIDA
jgi:glutamate dehydrogenase/leucine dehydrogenase